MVRLGDGTVESQARMQEGLLQVWPYLDEIFDDSWIPPELLVSKVAVGAAGLRSDVDVYLACVLEEATLTVPNVPALPTGGRQGIHTESMGYLLAELQHIHRSHPCTKW